MKKILTALILLFTSLSALADYNLPNGYAIFGRSGYYDYGPSIISDGKTEKFWWCGNDAQYPTTDTIQYRYFDYTSNQWSPITRVLVPTPGTWDSRYTCDPSVIQGSFKNPENGITYSYAMYYTATNVDSGVNNSIGLAYSNDGVNWVKYSQPVIRPQQANGSYGAGQAATYKSDANAGTYVFYTDTTGGLGGREYVRHTDDGINFGAPTLISDANNAGVSLSSNADFAYDNQSGMFYAIRETAPYRSGDREAYQLMLARMPASDLFAGTGTWEVLGFMGSAMTGFYMNHNPGLLRDGFGNVNISLPAIAAYFAGGTNDPTTWDLTTVLWKPTPQTLALNRYMSSTCGNGYGDHLVTTGYVQASCGYRLEATLGYLDMGAVSGEVPLYACKAGGDDFLSRDPACEGQQPQGIIGFLSPNAGGSTRAIYRCITGYNTDHFVSLDPGCEGQVAEGLLGYVKSSP